MNYENLRGPQLLESYLSEHRLPITRPSLVSPVLDGRPVCHSLSTFPHGVALDASGMVAA